MAATAAILDPILTKNNRLPATTNVNGLSKFQVNPLRNATCSVRTNKQNEILIATLNRKWNSFQRKKCFMHVDKQKAVLKHEIYNM